MIQLLLDTNHLSEIERDTEIGRRLALRLEAAEITVAIPIVCVDEALRGWLHAIHRSRSPEQFLAGYTKLKRCVESYAAWTIAGWTRESAAILDSLQRQRMRIGTNDLRIAAIALAEDATLLSRNLTDFRLVPGLRVENWLD